MKELWRKIGTVWPDNGFKFFFQRESGKLCLILQWLEHFTPKFTFEINFALYAIGKFQPDAIVTSVLCFLQFRQHGAHSIGGMRADAPSGSPRYCKQMRTHTEERRLQFQRS